MTTRSKRALEIAFEIGFGLLIVNSSDPLVMFVFIAVGESALIIPVLLKIEIRQQARNEAQKHSKQDPLPQAKSTRKEQ